MSSEARWRQLTLNAVVQVLVLGLWFSASTVLPALRNEWSLSNGDATWLTNAVQLGFVCGAVVSAILNLSDLVSLKYLIAFSAITGAVANAGFALWAHGLGTAIPLRLVTGMALAGVYPPGMKLMASWFRSHRGLAIGVLVGSLTFGSGSPHLIEASASLPWRGVLWVSSALALMGGALVLLWLREGPLTSPATQFAPGYVVRMFRDRPQRLVNLGYFGHMWELYAVWAWLPAYVTASYAARAAGLQAHARVELTVFAAIALAGLTGAVLGGLLADRYGRAELTIGAMTISGASALLTVAAYGLDPIIVITLLLVWGAAVIADSAQFSAALTELADNRYVGTALTAQTAIGFLITVGSIRFVPWFAGEVGWRWAFAPLAVGPVAGIGAMAQLRRHLRFAGGRA